MKDESSSERRSAWGYKLITPDDRISLRDYFAGQALAGLIASTPQHDDVLDVCKDAYVMADAMLKMRGQ